MLGVGKGPSAAIEVFVEPGNGGAAGSLTDVQLGDGGAKPNRPLDRSGAVGELDDKWAGLALHDRERADRRTVRGPLHVHAGLRKTADAPRVS